MMFLHDSDIRVNDIGIAILSIYKVNIIALVIISTLILIFPIYTYTYVIKISKWRNTWFFVTMKLEDDGGIASEENDEESEDGVNKPVTYNML